MSRRSRSRSSSALALLYALYALTLAGAALAAAAPQDHQAPEPILILVSFDGWRADYTDRLPAPNLRALAARGVRAKGLIPSFPVLTFPNHYTLVTGLYPEHHGVVGNAMTDASMPERFTMSAETSRDPRWWGGEPVWVTAIRHGRRASAMFWPGSEVVIGGIRPTAMRVYDETVPNADRVMQVLTWLALPDAERPAFVSVYFEAVDSAGHQYGIGSRELTAAARALDQALGQLVSGVRRLGLDGRTTIVVVSDHGMARLSPDRVVYLDDYIDPQTVDVVEWTATLTFTPRDGDVDAAYRRLHGKHPKLAIYKRADVPAHLHYNSHPRIPAIVGIPADGWAVTTRARLAERKLNAGAHGYDRMNRSMHALFVAAGPPLRRRLVVAPFENVHVYELLCAILKLPPAQNDGDPAITRGFLR
jgi:predicted AlkP superfamily pyrophosphatase or phosphodiesterase